MAGIAARIGAAYVHHDISYARTVNTYSSDDHDWMFAYQLMAGVSWSINPQWELDLMYRYYRIDHREHKQTSTNPNAPPAVDLDPQGVDSVVLGLRYSF
jgi:opacity protein-like surface antigen